jgi:hypothetical protein
LRVVAPSRAGARHGAPAGHVGRRESLHEGSSGGRRGGSGRVRGEPIGRCHRGTGSRDQHDSNPAGTGITLERLSKAIGNSAALRELQPGEWMVGANIEIDKCASLTLSARPM